MTFDVFLQHLSNGISLGSLYALIAIGYTMVYGILRLINFAHGDIFMMSTYFASFGVITFGLPWYIAFPIVLILTALLGMSVESVAYRPLRDAPKISILISAIGASFLLENLATVIFGGIPKPFPTPDMFTDVVNIGAVAIQKLSFYIPIVAIVFLVGLYYLIHKTKTGMAMRAVSVDHETARVMGVNVNRTISLTFGIGSLLAAVGGLMWGMKFTQISPLMGIIPGLKCFIAAVIGGIGNINANASR